MLRSVRGIQRQLDAFHRAKVERCLREHSPIAGPQFRNDFNLAGFYPELNALADTPSSFWGIDRCLRIREAVDRHHSRVFHMGVFVRSIDLKKEFANPWQDPRFHRLQNATLAQFFAMLDLIGIDTARMHVSCFGGATIGDRPDGRDRALRRRYRFPEDRVSSTFLRRRNIKTVVVPTIASLFIQPMEGSLVGPRLEVFHDDLEFATIMFDCFRIRRGALERINYVAAYGVGLERVLAVITGADFLHCIPRYVRARQLIERRIQAAGSFVLEREVAHVLYGLETLAAVPERLSRAQRELVTRMKAELKFYILNLGLPYRDVLKLFRFFQTART
jgi:hypothetical protein